MLVKYLYSYESQKKPFGVIVATKDGIGLSMCNPKDDFNKEMGKKIALGRISRGHKIDILSSKKVRLPTGSRQEKRKVVEQTLLYMKERATKYFN